MKCVLLACLVAATVAGAGLAQGQDIHALAAAGETEKVRAALQANPALANLRALGTTPLHEAARHGHLEVVKLLVAGGAQINTADSAGLTPLRLAMGYQRKEVAAWLRANGGLEKPPVAPRAAQPPAQVRPPAAPVRTVPAPPKTQPVPAQAPPAVTQTPPLSGRSTPSAAAPRAPAASATNSPGMDPLLFPIHQAAEVGDADQVKALLKAWPELIEAQNEKGLTPLHVAAGNGRSNVLEVLLPRRANVHALTRYGWTPLHFAATAGDPATVALLLAYGAGVNVRTRTDETPLHMAARGGHVEAARQLLARRADPNSAEKTTGSTPLHAAVVRGSLPLVELLIAAGADVNRLDGSGDAPLTLALSAGRDAVAVALQRHGARLPDAPPLTPLEQSLVEHYRKLDQTLRAGSNAEKRKAVLAATPTRADMRQLFPAHAAAAEKVADELNQQVRMVIDRGIPTPVNDGEIWAIQPAPPSPYIQYCQGKGWISPNAPIRTLTVKRKGRKSLVDTYCYVNERWLPLPPLSRILPDK